MNIRHWFVLGALCAPLAALAQQAPEQQRPQDAGAAVPALSYVSAFDGFQSAVSAEQPSPDKVWRAANQQVANTGEGHDGHAGHAAPAPQAEAPAPKAPAGNPPPKTQHQHEAHKHD